MKGVGQANNNAKGHMAQAAMNATPAMDAATAMNAAVTPAPAATPAPGTPAADFGQLGLTFNDATRALAGGLWQTAVEEGGQGLGSVFRYNADLQTVQQGLQSGVAAGQFTGDTLTHVQTILQDLSKASAAATASVNGGGSFGSVAAAEKVLHDTHLDVLNVVHSDQNLHGLATQNGGQGFLAAPPALPNGVTPQNAPHADLAQIGAIFDDFANKSLGGINASNQQALTSEVKAIASDMQQLMQAHPDQFQGLTGVHGETIVRQLQLQEKFIHDATTNPVAGRASNDNILDIIDIVQGDANLAHMANNGTVSGFTPFGDALHPTPKYLDNQAQTNFWAGFIAQSNSLGDKAVAAVSAGGNPVAGGIIGELMQFQNQTTKFDASQGGIFEARFDNELLGKTSTLGAEVSKMIEGLHTGNVTLVQAAAAEMHANAADVAGNNVPLGGGTYNTDGRTVADVLSTAAGGQVADAGQHPGQGNGLGMGNGGQNGHGNNGHAAQVAAAAPTPAQPAPAAQHADQQQAAHNAGVDAHGVQHPATVADVLAGAAHIAAATPAPAQPAPAAQPAAQPQPAHAVAVDAHAVQPVDAHDPHAHGLAHMWG